MTHTVPSKISSARSTVLQWSTANAFVCHHLRPSRRYRYHPHCSGAAMSDNPKNSDEIREAIVDSVRILADLLDVLGAIQASARLAGAALQKVENNVLLIDALMDGEEGSS
jgi:hypothetical protein